MKEDGHAAVLRWVLRGRQVMGVREREEERVRVSHRPAAAVP